MEPLGQKKDVVDIADLTRWNFTQLLTDDEEKPEDVNKSHFPCRNDLNAKLILWKGDMLQLNVHAVVHPTNENFSEKYALTAHLLKEAGPDMLTDINTNIRGFKTGEARLSKGHKLLSRYVIHTVGPRYNVKYTTAAESALYNSYRNVLQVALEHNIQSVGICPIHSSQRGYPLIDGAHLAIRTVRRFLEKFGSNFETIIFVSADEEVMEVYQQLMPLYFPRNWKEEMEAKNYLPENIGNEEGEPVIPERKIRIIDKPAFAALKTQGKEFDETIDLNQEFRSPDGPEVGRHPFAQMKEDKDKERLTSLQCKPSVEQREKEKVRQAWSFSRRHLLKVLCITTELAKQAKSSQKDKNGSCYELKRKFILTVLKPTLVAMGVERKIFSSVDRFGRPVLVFIGKNLPVNHIDLEKVLQYIVQVMDSIADTKYSVIYLHTLTTTDNLAPTSFLKYAYNVLHDKYKKNLVTFYIVHSNIWFKISTWFFTTFTAPEIKTKISHLQGTDYLYAKMNTDQLDLPQWIFEYDVKVNGPRYYVPAEDPTEDL
uniref:Macro domain-containing protein n=1 Tax=Octopus bimaculoides TaxID=37653 RepID=A0A0L8H9E5_OCTBM